MWLVDECNYLLMVLLMVFVLVKMMGMMFLELLSLDCLLLEILMEKWKE